MGKPCKYCGKPLNDSIYMAPGHEACAQKKINERNGHRKRRPLCPYCGKRFVTTDSRIKYHESCARENIRKYQKEYHQHDAYTRTYLDFKNNVILFQAQYQHMDAKQRMRFLHFQQRRLVKLEQYNEKPAE